jgi:hypothetical protein
MVGYMHSSKGLERVQAQRPRVCKTSSGSGQGPSWRDLGIRYGVSSFAHVLRYFAVFRERFADDSRIRDDSRGFAHVSRTFCEILAQGITHVSHMFRAFSPGVKHYG